MARMRNIIQQHWLLPIWVLGLTCSFSLPSTARAPSSIVLYEIDQTLSLSADDIKQVVAQRNKHDDGVGMEIDITEPMTNRVHAFTAALVGKMMGTMLLGKIVSDATSVRSAVAGTRLYMGGQDTPSFHKLARRFENALATAPTPQTTLMMSFEIKQKITLTQRDIVFQRNRGPDTEIQLSDAFLRKARGAGTGLQNNQWLLALNNDVIGDQSTLSIDNDGLLVLRGGAAFAPLRVDGVVTSPRK